MGYCGCAHHRRDAHARRVRRDHVRRHARIARARRADHQGSAELPGRDVSVRRRPTGDAYMAALVALHEDPHPRFRRAVHAADRAPRARGARLLRAPSLRRRRRVRARVRAAGHHPVRRPRSAYEGDTPRAPQAVFELGVPVLGICYGMQTMAAQLGGKVEAGKVREFGYAEVRARGHSTLLDGIQDRANAEGHGLLDVWMSHGDKVTALPPGFKLIARATRLPDRRHGRRVAPLLRRAVPSRSHAHAAGHGDPRALRARDLRLRRRLEHARLHRRGGRRASARRSAATK